MSRSLSRIRNLVSEIEEIQRQGQQGGRAALDRTTNQKPVPETPKPRYLSQEPAPLKSVAPQEPSVSNVFSVSQAPQVDTPIAVDPFESLDSLFAIPTPPPANLVVNKPENSGKVFMHLAGQVVLSLQIENSDEIVELRHHGGVIEIRFADGKAVHLPLKTVA